MPVAHELSSFIRSTFRSVWALELLCLLRAHGHCAWTHHQMVAALRASDLVIAQSIGSLVAAGLIVVDANHTARYHPISDKVDKLVEATEQLYERRPDLVRRLIVAPSSDALSSFADAFKIRKD